MSELNELYKEVIFDHNKNPRNFRKMEDANRVAGGSNPLCGDKVTVYARVSEGRIEDLSFEGKGCAISTASASMLTTELKGKTIEEARERFMTFIEMLTGDPSERDDGERLGKLAVFSGVKEYPVRVKCATLAWHTLKNALDDASATATTE